MQPLQIKFADYNEEPANWIILIYFCIYSCTSQVQHYLCKHISYSYWVMLTVILIVVGLLNYKVGLHHTTIVDPTSRANLACIRNSPLLSTAKIHTH